MTNVIFQTAYIQHHFTTNGSNYNEYVRKLLQLPNKLDNTLTTKQGSLESKWSSLIQ